MLDQSRSLHPSPEEELTTNPAAAAKFSVPRQPVIDISQASNSAQACQLLEQFVLTVKTSPGKTVELNAGNLLLTRGVLAKMNLQLKKHGVVLQTVYATVPQTQQAALDEGFFVKEAPTQPPLTPFEDLNRKLAEQAAALPVSPVPVDPTVNTSGVELPSFAQRAGQQATHPTGEPLANLTLADISSLLQPPVKTPVPTVDTKPVLPIEKDLMGEITDVTEIDFANAPDQTEDVPAPNPFPTLFVKHTLRSGQVLRYHGNIVVIGDVHAGSEITASGDILVWGEIRGIAHAGAEGNFKAEIRGMQIEALQLRIADFIARRPDRIYYHKQSGSQLPAPEVAKVHDGEIRIFKEAISN